MKIDMLEVKKDRVREIVKQLSKMHKTSKYTYYDYLEAEKKKLLREIKDIENKR